jgi:topoisomerase-4 subunit A
MVTGTGKKLSVFSEKAPIEERRSTGRLLATLDKGEALTDVFPTLSIESKV